MNMKMKQAVLVEAGKIELREVAVPEPGPDQALIRVRAVGICGSDIHTFHGKHPFVHPPLVLGHEAAGDVVGLGKNVDSVAIGDKVVLRPQRTCGICRPCRRGRYNICEKLNVLGCLSDGASSEYYAVEASLLYKLPAGMEYGLGTTVEPLAVGVHAVRRGGDVAGANVLVIGAGTIGVVTALAAKCLGANAVMITDVSDFKLNMARQIGVDHIVNVKNADLRGELKRVFGNDEIEVIYECSASQSGIAQAVEIAPKGITIVVVGVFETAPRVDLAGVQDREYSLVGTLMYTHQDYVAAIQSIAENKVDLSKLITHRFPLEKNQEAYAFIDSNRDTVQKVVIDI